MEVSIAMATSVKKCEYCGCKKTNITTNEAGTKYEKWHSNPYKEGWICEKCYRNYLFLKPYPLTSFRRHKIRKERK
jgi:hypothetical protein